MSHNTREEIDKKLGELLFNVYRDEPDSSEELTAFFHQELQKAREEERERIEAIFKEHVPPHAMDLEDSVWLKRLLNKAFEHENIY